MKLTKNNQKYKSFGEFLNIFSVYSSKLRVDFITKHYDNSKYVEITSANFFNGFLEVKDLTNKTFGQDNIPFRTFELQEVFGFETFEEFEFYYFAQKQINIDEQIRQNKEFQEYKISLKCELNQKAIQTHLFLKQNVKTKQIKSLSFIKKLFRQFRENLFAKDILVEKIVTNATKNSIATSNVSEFLNKIL